MPQTGPLLKLDTLVQRDYLTIDGEPYDLRNAEELSLFDRERIIHYSTRMRWIEQKAERTNDDDVEYGGLVQKVVAMIVDAPASVLDRLERPHREAICLTFIGLLLARLDLTRAKAPETPAGRRTGAKSRRGSRGSTAARRRTG